MTNSLDPDQTAPIRAVCFGSTLFAVSNVRQLFAADDFSRRHFQMHFFQPHCDLGVVRTTAYFKAIMEVYRILVKLSTHYDAEVSCLKCVTCMHFYMSRGM